MNSYSKENLKKILLLVFFSSVLACSFGQKNKIVYSQAKLYLKTITQLRELRKNGVEFDHGHYDPQTNTFINTFLKTDLPKIKALGIKYQVLVDDEQQDFLRRNKPDEFYKYTNPASIIPSEVSSKLPFQTCATNWNSSTSWITPTDFTAGSVGGYYNFSEIETKLNNMATNYPNLVTKFSIGTTYEGRDIWCIKISDNPTIDENEPEVLYTGLHHAREPMSIHNLIFFMQYILQNYSSDARISQLLNNRELFFIPIINADGYVFNITNNPTGGGMHRKNTRNIGGQTNIGIDLNRNYGVGFGEDNIGSSNLPEENDYRGASAFSEQETQVLRSFINARRFKLVLNHHSFGNFFVRPPSSYTAAALATATDINIFKKTGSLFSKYNCYKVGLVNETLGYDVNGNSDDWLLLGDASSRAAGFEKIYGFTPEIGELTFWPTAAQIIPLCREMMFPNFQAAYTCGPYVEVEDNGSPEITSLSGNFTFRLTRAGLLDAPASVEIIPIQNIAAVGSSVNVAALANYGDVATGNISYTLPAATPNQQIIQFVWKVTTSGMIFTDTVTKIYNPAVLFRDDMEGTYTTKWTKSSSGFGSSNDWSYTALAAFNGSKSMSQSSTGTYPLGQTWYSNCNTVINLSGATNAYLSFWLKNNSDNCKDILRVEVSTNGGSTYTPVCGSNSVTENRFNVSNLPAYSGISNGWRREIVNLSSYIGATNLRFRFTFISQQPVFGGPLTSTGFDGFYIDDVVLLKGSLASNLDANFVSLTGNAINNKAIINWESFIDTEHRFFVIERSHDGTVFQEIGTNDKTGSQFSFTDNAPLLGQNLYRIKAVDNQGKLQYSNVVSLKFSSTKSIKVFPNPTTDWLQFEINGLNTNEPLFIQISDLTGRIIKTETVKLNQQYFTYRLKTKGIAKGLYAVTIRSTTLKNLLYERVLIE